MAPLRPCPTCARHARGDARCPFCGAAIPPVPDAPQNVVSRRRFTRDAVVAAGAVLALGCGGPEPRDDSGRGRARAADAERLRREAPLDPCEPIPDALAIGHVEVLPRVQRERDEACREQWHSVRRHRCTPDGVCPPYGAPPHPELV